MHPPADRHAGFEKHDHPTPPPLAVPTLETNGGTMRCMIADLHLSRR